MLKSLLAYALLACLFQGYLLLDRNEIVAEYQPFLDNKTIDFTDAYNLSAKEYSLIIAQIKNNTWTAVATMTSQIAAIKATIVQAQNISENNTAALNCLTRQQTAANDLTPVPINSTCWVGVTYPDFAAARDAIGTLAGIPAITISACTTLNPLPNQDELFLNCITDKILDLDDQFEQLQSNFTEVRTDTINTSVECISDQSALITSKIVEINFQVTLCLSLN
ncbi:hypothetical protein Zmor_009648 [Zophobas morio]|uniref:Protein TsetseEP domain-containing protein n=1 Tax=Zophobas morio TaxID=2755281 RepID=A0AA38IJE0_9CUCU|nr:hypothetical protein Zmor_009648 [Zophobas morio]